MAVGAVGAHMQVSPLWTHTTDGAQPASVRRQLAAKARCSHQPSWLANLSAPKASAAMASCKVLEGRAPVATALGPWAAVVGGTMGFQACLGRRTQQAMALLGRGRLHHCTTRLCRRTQGQGRGGLTQCPRQGERTLRDGKLTGRQGRRGLLWMLLYGRWRLMRMHRRPVRWVALPGRGLQAQERVSQHQKKDSGGAQ